MIWPLFKFLGQKLSNFFVGILVETMTPKRHFEINWPLEIQIQNHYVLLWTHCNVVVLKLNTKHVQTFWKEKRTALKDMPYLNFSTSNFRVVNLWVLHTLHSTMAEIFISIEIRYFGGDNKLLLFFPRLSSTVISINQLFHWLLVWDLFQIHWPNYSTRKIS